MPCADNQSDIEDKERRRLLDERTRQLCACCKAMVAAGLPIPPEAIEWWTNHQKVDQDRARGYLLDSDFKWRKEMDGTVHVVHHYFQHGWGSHVLPFGTPPGPMVAKIIQEMKAKFLRDQSK